MVPSSLPRPKAAVAGDAVRHPFALLLSYMAVQVSSVQVDSVFVQTLVGGLKEEVRKKTVISENFKELTNN